MLNPNHFLLYHIILKSKYDRNVCEELIQTYIDARYYNFGVNVWNIDSSLPKMKVAKKSIRCLEKLLYEDLELTNNLSDLNIDSKNFEEMANRICNTGIIEGFVDLNKDDIINIFKECL